MRHSSELDILCKSHFSILCVTLNTYLCREQREDTSPTLCGIRMLDRGAGAGPGQTLTAKVIINQPPTPSLLNGLLRFSASAFSLRADTHNRQMGPLSFSFFFFLKSLSGVHCVPLSVCLSSVLSLSHSLLYLIQQCPGPAACVTTTSRSSNLWPRPNEKEQVMHLKVSPVQTESVKCSALQ